MSVDAPSAAADPYARQRLDDTPVGVQHGQNDYLFTLDGGDVTVLACVDQDVDAGRAHHGIAAVCHAVMAELHHEREVLKE